MSALHLPRPRLPRPTEAESRLARESSRKLGAGVAGVRGSGPGEGVEARVVVHVAGRPAAEPVNIPPAAFEILRLVLDEMAKGHAVTITPVKDELTTQEAAELLGVSRPFLIKLIDGGAIAARKVGRHRRVRFDDLMRYKQATDADRARDLDALVEQAQELGMGY